MDLDVRSMLVGITVLELAVFLAMFLFWRTQQTYPGFGQWTSCTLMVLLGCLLLGLHGLVPMVVSEVLGNTAFVLGGILRLRGIRLFLGLKAGGSLGWLYVPLTAAALFWYAVIEPDWPMRTMVISLPLALLGLQAVWHLLRGRGARRARTLYRAVAVAILFFVVLLMTRALVLVSAGPGASLFMVHPAQTAYFLGGLMVEVFWNMTFIMMNSNRLAEKLREARDELANLAGTDPLTGVLNRRSLMEKGRQEVERARRYGHELTVLVLDLDHFKLVNDSLGHQAGDDMLRAAMTACAERLRAIDLLGRVGGDEFVVILPETDLAGAERMAQRLREGVAACAGCLDQGLPLSMSAGIAALCPADRGLSELLHRADLAMYRAKEAGRDRVEVELC